MTDHYDDDEDYYCAECGLGGLLCKCEDGPGFRTPADDPRDYNPESDPKRYYQDEEE